VKNGDDIEMNIATGLVTVSGQNFSSEQMPSLPREILAAGGMVPWVKRKLDKD